MLYKKYVANNDVVNLSRYVFSSTYGQLFSPQVTSSETSRVTMYGLPAETPMFQFYREEQCGQILDQQLDRFERTGEGPYVIITSVDERSFLECFTRSRYDLLRKSCVSYDKQHSIILIEMESKVHASACHSFTGIIETWGGQAESILMPSGSASFRGTTRTKRGDCSWMPAEIPSGRSPKWPTLAVEVQWSEPTSHLMDDIRFWLDDSEGDVRIILTISISARYTITIQRWSLRYRQNQSKPLPFPIATVQITKGPNKTSQPRITGSMTIPFEEVFLRPRRPTESDLILSRPVLERMALQIWTAQDQQ